MNKEIKIPVDKSQAEAIIDTYAEHHSLKDFESDIQNADSQLRKDLAGVGYEDPELLGFEAT